MVLRAAGTSSYIREYYGAYKAFVALTIASLLIGSVSFVAPRRSFAVDYVPGTPDTATYYVSDGQGGDAGCETSDASTGGYADDASAIEAALDLAAADGTGGIVVIHLCAGSFDLSSGVTVTKGDATTQTIVFEGEGTAATTVRLSANVASLTTALFTVPATEPVDTTYRDLTISGARHEGSPGKLGGAVASLSDGSTVRVESARFVDNSAGTDGGAIYAAGPVVVVGSEFSGNTAAGAGGAVYSGATFASTDGTYEDNTAATGDGGAIYAQHVTLDADHFSRNRALAQYGGAVFARYTFAATDAEFRDNFANWVGGAVHASDGPVVLVGGMYDDNTSEAGGGGAIGTNGPVSVDGTKFHRNRAGFDGGAIKSSSVASTDGTYEDNTANTGSGGAVVAVAGQVTSDSDEFRRNSAGKSGGGIFASSASVSGERSTFEENTAGTGGGPVYDRNGGAIAASSVAFTASTFARNRADNVGGAIHVYQYGGSVDLTNATFVANFANEAEGSTPGGGAIWAPNGNVGATNVTFMDNTTRTGLGGTLGNYDGLTLTATDSIFDGGSCHLLREPTVNGANFRTSGATDCPGTLVTSAALKLGPVADNGGPTETVALGFGSVAIDAATTSTLTIDQRGKLRPFGDYPDSGAYEDRSISVRPDSGPGLSDVTCTFTTIQAAVDAAAAGDTIHLCEGDHSTNSLAGGLSVNKDLTFEGDGSTNTIVDGDGTFRLFLVSSATVAFRDLTLRDGYGGAGGAVYAGDVTMSDVRLIDNVATAGGGAILASGAAVLTRVHARGNSAGSSGGVILADGIGAVSVSGGDFIENTAQGAGGAIFAGTSVDLRDATFSDNTTATHGGAIAVEGPVALARVLFDGNEIVGTGTDNGGAVWADGDVTVVDSVFTYNAVASESGIGSGGAIYADSRHVTATGSKFLGNSAHQTAGAIDAASVVLDLTELTGNTSGLAGGAVNATDSAHVVRSTFAENAAYAGFGGAIVSSVVEITASTFSGNSAFENGGAIRAYTSVTATNSTFVENSVDAGTPYWQGGAIKAGSLTVVNVTFLDGTAGAGSLVYVNTLHATDSIFAGGTCVKSGGTPTGVNYSTHASCPNGGGTVTKALLKLDKLADNGGPTKTVALLPGSVAIDPAGSDSSQTEDQRGFLRPANWGDSGAFERTGATRITIVGPTELTEKDEVTFTVSVSSGDDEVTGGTLSFSDGTTPIGECDLTSGTHGTCDFTTSSLEAGTRQLIATYSGTSGDVAREGATRTFRVRVVAPTSDYYVASPETSSSVGSAGGKGGVGILSDCSSADFDDIQDAIDFAAGDGFDANTIHICAGRFVRGVTLAITTGDNTAGLTIEGDGRALTVLDGSGGTRLFHVDSTSSTTFADLTLTRGAATGDGGAIESVSDGTIRIERADLTSNTASDEGGAIYAVGDVEVSDGTFVENTTATGDGGAIYAGGNVTSDPSLYQDNSTGSDGGAIYAGGIFTTIGDTFTGNRAPAGAGGAVYAVDAVTIVAGTFSGNESGNGGGAVYGAGTVSISDGSDFADNTAGTDGGAIYGQDVVSVTDATFTDNSAGSDGGAIFATGEITSTRSHFSRNIAADPSDNGFGGAIGTFGWSVVVDGGSFAGNRATGRGGAVHAYNLDVTGGTVFSDNTCGDAGGAIFSRYGADLRDLVFTDNSSGGWGGAVAVDDSALSVARSTFTGNVTGGLSTQGGGAIGLNGAATVEDSTFERNTALAGNGGAILSQYSTVTVERSTFLANRAPYGGAIKSAGAATARNATFLENTAATYGGAINASDVTLVYVTLKDDTAGTGGHVYATGTFTITQTILAGGTCSVVPASATGANFATDPSCVTTGVTSVTSGDLKLAALRKSGRSLTPTLALRRGSVAIDPALGQTTCDVATDQRGIPRPQASVCDAGAFERTGLSRITIETLDNPVRFGQAAPRFHVSVTTGEGGTEVTGGTVLLFEIVPGTLDTPQRQYVATPCMLTPEKHGACDFTTGVDPRLYFVGRHRLMATYSGQGDPELDPEGAIDPSQTTGDQYVIRNGTQLLYTGETYVAGGVGYTYAAALGDITAGSGCASPGRTIRFYRGYSDGTYEATPFATGTTNGSGVATATGDLSLANNGINEVLIEYSGGSDCEPAVTTATILVDSSGGTSSGGGHYVVPGAGRVNLAYRLNFTTTKVRGVDVNSTSGDIVWHSNGKFRMKGAISAYTKLASCPTTTLDGRAQSYTGPGGGSTTVTCGYFSGSGTLYMWFSLNGVSRWVPIGTGIGFQVTVGDGGDAPTKGNGKGPGSNSGKGGGKDYTDWFRMNIPAALVTGESAGLEPLKGGNLVVR